MMTTFAIPADGTITWVGDGSHKGADIYYSERRRQWVVIDLENRDVTFADRLVAYRSKVDGDQTGLNLACVACDFDGPSALWIVDLDADEDATPDHQDVDLEWDSAE